MFLKTFGIAAPVVMGGLWVTGVLGGSAYSRDVARPQAEVMAALADLDISAQPGAPGSDPAASGGVAPLFRVERGADSMTWWVMSGDKVATRMTAHFAPTDDGKGTRITASVERGDAPDDFVPPAFRSEKITLGLFSLALEGELNELAGAQVYASAEQCTEIRRQFLAGGMAAGMQAPAENAAGAIGGVAQMAMRMHALDAELRRNGCPTDAPANPDELMLGPEGVAAMAAAETRSEEIKRKLYVNGGNPNASAPMLDPTPQP